MTVKQIHLWDQEVPLERGVNSLFAEFQRRFLIMIEMLCLNLVALGIFFLALKYPGAFASITSLLAGALFLAVAFSMLRARLVRRRLRELAYQFSRMYEALESTAPDNMKGSLIQSREQFWKTYSNARTNADLIHIMQESLARIKPAQPRDIWAPREKKLPREKLGALEEYVTRLQLFSKWIGAKKIEAVPST